MNLARIRIWPAWEKGLGFLALLVITGIVMERVSEEVQATQGNPVLQAVYAGIYLLAPLWMVFHPQRVAQVMSRDVFLWLLMLVVLASLLWSTTLGLTLRRGMAFFGTTLCGVYLACRYSPREQVRLLGGVLVTAAALSLGAGLLWPEFGIRTEIGGQLWRGVYENKNVLGRLMALGVVATLFAMRNSRYRLRWAGGSALCLGMLLLTRSTTALMVLLSTLMMIPIFAALRWNHRVTLALVLIPLVPGLLNLAWVLPNLDLVFALLGKDVTLTGRTGIWELVLESIAQRPWLGYGFSGFWRGWEGESGSLWRLLGATPAHAHNVFLDTALDLGLIGLGVFVVGFAVAYFRTIRQIMRTRHDGVTSWPLVCLTFVLFYSLTESNLVRPHSLLWVLYVAATLSRPDELEKAHPEMNSPAIKFGDHAFLPGRASV